MSQLLLGQQLEGIWHSGLVAFGLEYFYAGGIVSMPPEKVEAEYDLKVNREIMLGTTTVDMSTFHQFLKDNEGKFTADKYDIIHWNCNHFTNECSKFLLAKEIDGYILHQHEVVAKLPMGGMILNLIRSSQQMMQNQATESGSRSLWTPPATSSETPTPTPTRFVEGICLLCSDAKKTVEFRLECLQQLNTVLTNIITYTNEEKYRNIKKSNKHVADGLLSIDGGLECLLAAGFKPHTMQLEGSTIESLKIVSLDSVSLNVLRRCKEEATIAIDSMSRLGHYYGAGVTQEKLDELVNMGAGTWDRHLCLRALRLANGDINGAIDQLTLEK